MTAKTWWAIVLVIVAIGAFIGLGHDFLIKRAFAPTESSLSTGVKEPERELVTVVVENLEVPWEIRWLPRHDGQANQDMLITERPGRLVRFAAETGEKTSIVVPGVTESGESGLLGLAIDPQFQQNNHIYLYLTTDAPERDEDVLINRVERYEFVNDELRNRAVLLDGIAGAKYHDGGRMEFAPDGWLYITTGDAGQPELARDPGSLSGKVLRISRQGVVETVSSGHRNAQGLAWDDQGQLWSNEHGRSGVRSGLDELNLIVEGGDYGWPESEGDKVEPGTVGPVVHSGPDETWAPAGLAWWRGALWTTGLRGESLYEYRDGELTRHFTGQFGRLRAVRVGPDGALYVSTSNQDGRGEVRAGDDKIIRIDPKQFP